MADLGALLAELRALRQDLESQAAIAVVAGINAVETQALLGHFMRRRQPPTPSEAAALSRLARERWAQQVRQAVALARHEPGAIDDSLPLLLQAMGGTAPTRRARRSTPRPKRPTPKPAKPTPKPKQRQR
jgi:hypothetical protein